MARYDIEDCIDDFETLLKTSLNTKIAAIESEKSSKGKGLTTGLSSIAEDAFFRQTWSDKILNYTPAIFFGIENVETTSGGQLTSENLKIFIECVIVDSGMDTDTHRRINRYSRAIKELIEENFDKLSFASRIKVETVRPTAFKLELDTSEEIKVGGVSVSLSII